jgi:UDP-glucuronate 4-epimerase
VQALVTGCAGFIASHLTESLLADGHAVTGIDCFNDNYGRKQKLQNLDQARSWDQFDFVPVDLTRGELREFVSECDVVFHLAAEPGVRASWGDRFDLYLRNNMLATQHLLEAAREFPEKRFVYASSSSIYGDAESMPTPEDTIPAPFSPYGVTKLGGEQMCQLYHGNYGVDAVMLRYFSVYGPRQRPDMAFRIFCEAVVAGKPVTVFGDGEQTRDFTFVGDVVAATRAAADSPIAAGRVYNIGGGSQVSLNDAMAELSTIVGRKLDVSHVERQRGDVRHTGADTTRAQREIGFDPETSLTQGLQAEFDWVSTSGVSVRG